MNDVLLAVDLFTDFAHEDGGALRASFVVRWAGMKRRLDAARHDNVPIVYANDNAGLWQSDAAGMVRRAQDGSEAGRMSQLAPQSDDRFVLKPRYSAFDHTPLELIIEELESQRVLLFGT